MNIIIVGAGDIGYHLCNRLTEDNNDCTLIELDPDIARKAREHLDASVITGSGSSFKILQRAGIDKADIFIAVTQNDDLNIVASMIAKKSGVKTTIARIRNPEYSLMKGADFGIDLVVHPEMEVAKAVSHLVRQSSASDFYEFENGRIKVIGIRLDDNFEFYGNNLIELSHHFKDLPLRVLAIKRGGITIIPKGQDILLRGDQIFVVASNKYLKEILNFFGKINANIRNVMIVGGGLVGEYVAKDLEKKIYVKIIESNEKKANLLAENLDKSLVIHGDGNDIDLLLSEDLSEMDEFIAVSGDDETNIITSMIASQMNVPRRIIMVKNVDYLRMSAALNVDSILCKPLISVNVIRQFIRRKKLASFAEIPGCDALILEMEADEKSKIVKKPLCDISIPESVIFGAVLRKNNDIEIPTGSTQINPGDKAIVFHLPGTTKDIERLF
ncbi:MAG: Trk system potassium transporter TrkA [Candidatus Kapabacteria bacterium]|nr:Trk system potassium transporter TrkA [Ignavibacteriota bacterium]MCW5886325.1 Trk system potassium transporter TrkA [Candidatus Kapabacteria bacterium]